MKIKSEIGDILSTRIEAERYRNEAIAEWNKKKKCVIDLESISKMTPSFADEFFAKLVNEIGMDNFKKSIIIENANNAVRHTILFAINNRQAIDDKNKSIS